MTTVGSHIGLIGLGVMGRNLALNFRDHDVAVTAWDPWPEARAWQDKGVAVVDTLAELVGLLPRPRAILMLVKAGEPVDALLSDLTSLLDEGDIIIDAGNSRFSDTDRRAARMEHSRLRYVGLGVSGGAEGARAGPAIMAGCDEVAWQSVRSLLEPVAARSGHTICLERFGTGGAGHFVKMVHNGIEYAVMQAIAEVWHALRFTGNIADTQIADALAAAQQGYLIEITREILRTADADTGRPLLELISDKAGQKGTGSWCLEAALDLGIPVPSIAEAVAARQLSGMPHLRDRKIRPVSGVNELYRTAGRAIDAATAIALAQGFALALAANEIYGWDISIAAMARSWSSGSILRMPVLEALSNGVSDPHVPFMPPALRQMIESNLFGLRQFAGGALGAAQPVPVLTSSLCWYDALHLQVLPTVMVQAQRDRFGAHGFERTDAPGTHHGPWHQARS